MRLLEFHIHNYRNLDSISVKFASESAYIVGENNIGKSNLLNAISTVLSGKRFSEEDFLDVNKSIQTFFSLELDDIEIGLFDDFTDPLNEHRVNIVASQESPDDYIVYTHLESNENIPKNALRRLLVIYYDSLRNPRIELDFHKGKGAGSVLNYIVRCFISKQTEEIHYLNEEAITDLEKYTSNILSHISASGRFGIVPKIEKNDQELLSRLLVLRDTNNIDISSTGYGVQYCMLVVLSILEKIITFAKRKYSEELQNLKAILIFDEPEIHLHPYLQRALMHDILRIAKGCDEDFNAILKEMFGVESFNEQLIFATHSPYVISNDYHQIIRLYNSEDTVKAISACELDQAISQPEKKQLDLQYDTIKEAVFARGVIIVEGQSERDSFKYFANTMGYDLDAEGIGIVFAEGAESIPGLQKLFEALKIDNVSIMDRDKETTYGATVKNLYYTQTMCFDHEIVHTLVSHNAYSLMKSIISSIDSKAMNKVLQADMINKGFKKCKLPCTQVSKSYKLSDLAENNPLYEPIYTAWFSHAKGASAGKIIGMSLPLECIPESYKNVINTIIRLVRR